MFFCRLVAAIALVLSADLAAAADWPQKPVRILVIAHVPGRQVVDFLHWGTAASRCGELTRTRGKEWRDGDESESRAGCSRHRISFC
jgi:hypothetical protein